MCPLLFFGKGRQENKSKIDLYVVTSQERNTFEASGGKIHSYIPVADFAPSLAKKLATMLVDRKTWRT